MIIWSTYVPFDHKKENKQMKNYMFIPTFLLLMLLLSCNSAQQQSDEPFADCPQGKPSAVFNKEIQGIKEHQFGLKADFSIETVDFHNGTKLELIQSGCENVVQEYQFTFEGEPLPNDPAVWTALAVVQFKFLSSLGEAFAPFFMWATAIENAQDHFIFNEAHEIQPGFFVTLNKVSGQAEQILIVKLATQTQ